MNRHEELIRVLNAGIIVRDARIAELELESAEWSPVMQRLGDENQQLRAELATMKADLARYETTAENCDSSRAELAAIKGQVPVGSIEVQGTGFMCAPFHAPTWAGGRQPEVGTKLYAAPSPSAVVMPDPITLLDWNRSQPEPRPIVVGREYQVAEACARLNPAPDSPSAKGAE